MSEKQLTVYLKPGREKSVKRLHPWLFSGAIARMEGEPEAGGLARVCTAGGEFLAWAALSPTSQLALRIWSFDETSRIDAAFFERRFRIAQALRERMNIPARTDAYRLCASEGDGVPGVTVDVYGNYAVMQLTSAGADSHRAEIVEALLKLRSFDGIYERSDVAVRAHEGLSDVTGLLAGALPPERLEIQEDGRRFYVDIQHGHKTGFYCDQRDSRTLVERYADRCEVLNLFSYTGGFGVAALRGGASHVTNVDSSAAALALAADNFRLNDMDETRFTNVEADGFSYLRRCRGEQRRFDMVILDPPKLVESMKALPRGARAYKDAMLQGFHLLKPGGLMFTFSCSGLVPRELFAKIAADAALDAHCDARIVAELGQGADHPVPCAFPEARYLKGLLIERAE